MANTDDFPLALPVGTILGGQYRIEKVLGQGGFGITYRAIDHTTGGYVAVKEFFPDTLAYREKTTVISYPGERSENFEYGKEGFLQEARTLAEFIGNENIVRIYSYFEENGTAYFVMEYIEGVSFDKYLKDKGGKIPFDEAKRILVPIMDALAVVHSKGIVHRDVTPDNIYITNSGEVKLLDFGAARYSLGDKSRSLDVILKHGFAPKEQYTRRGKQGAFTDVYSLGATFYFALTGRRPPDSVDRLDEDDLIPPTSLGVKLTDYQERAIMQALSVQPYERFQNMTAFKNVMLAENAAEIPAAAPDASVQNQITFAAPPVQPTMAQQIQPTMAQQIQPTTAQQIQPTMAQQIQPTMAQPVQPTTAQPVQPSAETPVPAADTAPKKKKTGLIIGITAAAVAFVGIISAILIPNMLNTVETHRSSNDDSAVQTTSTSASESEKTEVTTAPPATTTTTTTTTAATTTTTETTTAAPAIGTGDSRIVGNRISNISNSGEFCQNGNDFFGNFVTGSSSEHKENLVHWVAETDTYYPMFDGYWCQNLCWYNNELLFLNNGNIYVSYNIDNGSCEYTKLETGCGDGYIKRFYFTPDYFFIYSRAEGTSVYTLYRYNWHTRVIEQTLSGLSDCFVMDDEYIYYVEEAIDGSGLNYVMSRKSTEFNEGTYGNVCIFSTEYDICQLSFADGNIYAITYHGYLYKYSSQKNMVTKYDVLSNIPEYKDVDDVYTLGLNVINDNVFIIVTPDFLNCNLYHVKLNSDTFRYDCIFTSDNWLYNASILDHQSYFDIMCNISTDGQYGTKFCRFDINGNQIN